MTAVDPAADLVRTLAAIVESDAEWLRLERQRAFTEGRRYGWREGWRACEAADAARWALYVTPLVRQLATQPSHAELCQRRGEPVDRMARVREARGWEAPCPAEPLPAPGRPLLPGITAAGESGERAA